MLEPVFTAEDTGCEYRFLKTAPAENRPLFSGRGFPRGFPGGTFFEHQGLKRSAHPASACPPETGR